ncbi:MAG TPA: MBL fold metallo-hydrolase [Candidatus Nanoarchaeia archaeon]|nr:MBL fold metallo-hydrolase [Candidatus Nanoarchaeia archaeon]
MQINNSGVELKWLGHSSFQIKTADNKIIYIDPYNISEGLAKADLILITHSHYDHCSIADIERVVQDGTTIVVSADSQSKITRLKVSVNIHIIEPDKEVSFGDVRISTLPAYNLDKSFHPKSEGWLGFLVRIGGVLIYHAGDTDLIPEMQKLTGFCGKCEEFIALLPVGGRFTMTAEEASEAAKLIKPTLAIPMHYGSVAGSEDDAKEFVSLCSEQGIKSEILEKG